MPRSVWKGPFVASSLIKSLNKDSAKGKKKKTQIKTYSRASLIMPNFIDKTIQIYNGKKFISVKITADMVGHKLGEFAPTRARYSFKKGNK